MTVLLLKTQAVEEESPFGHQMTVALAVLFPECHAFCRPSSVSPFQLILCINGPSYKVLDSLKHVVLYFVLRCILIT